MKGYKEFEERLEIIDAFFSLQLAIYPNSKLKTAKETFPNLLPKNIVDSFEQIELLNASRPNGAILNHLMLTNLSSTCDCFDLLIKNFLVDVLKNNKKFFGNMNLNKVDLSYVDSLTDKGDIIKYLEEKAIEEIYWKNFDEILKQIKIYAKSNPSLNLTTANFDNVIKSKKIRNLWVHHNGIVNQDFVKSMGMPQLSKSIGKEYHLPWRSFLDRIKKLKSTAFEIHMISHTKRKEMAKEALRETLRKLMNV